MCIFSLLVKKDVLNILFCVRGNIKKELQRLILVTQHFKSIERNPNNIQIFMVLFMSSTKIDNADHVKSRVLFPVYIGFIFFFFIIVLFMQLPLTDSFSKNTSIF